MSLKVVLVTLVFFISIAQLAAQPIRLSESKRVKEVEISVVPGVNNKGDKLFQIHFIKFKRLSHAIDTRHMTLYTDMGNVIRLSEPVKESVTSSSANSRTWFASFRLSQDQIDIIKREKLTELVYSMNSQQRSQRIPSSKAEELKELVLKHL